MRVAVPTKAKAIFDVTISVLKPQGAWEDFQRLRSQGCDINLLTALVASVALAVHRDTWPGWHGHERRRLVTVARRINQCATDVERFNSSPVASLLFARDNRTVNTHLLAIPKVLRIYADHLFRMSHVRQLQPRSNFFLNGTIAVLVNYVKKATRSYCDKEVASLLRAALNDHGYDAHRQIVWRRQHQELLRRTRKPAETLDDPAGK